MSRESLRDGIREGRLCYMHWVDNFAKFYRASSLRFNSETLRQCLWTAHGVKVWPGDVDMRYIRTADGQSVSALPFLEQLLDPVLHDRVVKCLQEISLTPWLSETSLCHQRNILRVPLKPSALSAVEAAHLKSSFDGLGVFKPVDLYPHNIVSTAGLLNVLSELQKLDGFGAPEHERAGSYSLLLVDVSIFWQLLRVYYCHSGMAPVRYDQFLLFGRSSPRCPERAARAAQITDH